jgi:hypothetical protein
MNCFYRTSASNRESFRVEPARPRRHQLGKKQTRTANQGKSASKRAPAAAGARTVAKATGNTGREPRAPLHAPRHIQHGQRTKARGQVYPGQINGVKVQNNA